MQPCYHMSFPITKYVTLLKIGDILELDIFYAMTNNKYL